MNIFEKFQTVIILLAVGTGLLLGQFVFLKRTLSLSSFHFTAYALWVVSNNSFAASKRRL